MNHDGEFFVGRRDGKIPPAVERVAKIARAVRSATVVNNICSILFQICLSVPIAAVSGLFLGDVILHPETQKLFAALALELFAVAEADGCSRDTVEESGRNEWRDILSSKKTSLEHADENKPWPPGIVDAYTHKGLLLEIDFANGAVVSLGRRYGIHTPVNEALLASVHAVERGSEAAGLNLLRRLTDSI